MAMVYDPELLSGGVDSSEELLQPIGREALYRRGTRKAVVVSVALLGAAAVAYCVMPGTPAASAVEQATMPAAHYVGLAAQGLMGTLSTGYDPNKTVIAELKGCCPLSDGKFLDCCGTKEGCCPSGNSTTDPAPLFCCAGMPTGREHMKKCVGLTVSNWCPEEAECCNGRCAGKDSICCGEHILCGKDSTCCRNTMGVYSCGSPHSECGGPQGGVTLRETDWPNPSTPLDWWNTSHNETKWGETIARTRNGHKKPPTPQECANRCGLHGSCCGEICCGKGATCCVNEFDVHTCGAVHALCGGFWGGSPLHEDFPAYVEPKFGETVHRVHPSPGETNTSSVPVATGIVAPPTR